MKKQAFWKTEFPSDLYLENFYRFLARKIVGSLGLFSLTANFVTFMRIPLGIAVFLLLVFSEMYLVLFGLMVCWKLLDKIDGAIARERGQITEFGAWFDVVVDRLFWGFTLLGLTIAAYRDLPTILPWILLFAILFGHTLFQNFSFLGQGLDIGKEQGPDWSLQVGNFRKNEFFYQVVFSVYYLWDQVLALALLFYFPIQHLFSVSTLFLTLVLYALFFSGATFYVLFVHYKELLSR